MASYGAQALMIGTVCLLIIGAIVSWKVAPETGNRGLDEAMSEKLPDMAPPPKA